MKKITLLIVLYLIYQNVLKSQSFKQNIKGVITDKHLNTAIEGAVVSIDVDSNYIVTSNKSGQFEFKDIPVGRIKLSIHHLQYQDVVMPNLLLTSGKELVVIIQMEEGYKSIKGVSIKNKNSKSKNINDMSVVSARTFSVEETQKFAAAVNDPARMVTSFAGVIASDDGNNTIVIRGNSPTGLLWRMEGIDIPGPNHFSSFNGSGGGISILSAQLMANSEFMTGAFAAEYGNALSGVFDIKLRKGNEKKREYTFQAGILGIDLAAEGPLSKKGGSYLVNYRYSTLGLLQKMGIDIFGNTQFQDLSFNIHLPKKKIGNISFFGFAGLSNQIHKADKDSSLWKHKSDRYNYYYGSNTYVLGTNHFTAINKNASLKTAVLFSHNALTDKGEFYKTNYTTTYTHWKNSVNNSKIAINSSLNYKLSSRLHLRTGIIGNYWLYKTESKSLDSNDILRTYLENEGSTSYFQTYAQLKFKASEKLNLFLGFHSIYLLLNNDKTIEPRASMRYNINKKQVASIGYGLHSQLQLPSLYFVKALNQNNENVFVNKNLKTNKAHHLVLSYEYTIKNHTRVKLEPYFQYLFDIPIGKDSNTTLSALNFAYGPQTVAMVNKGKGRNYGVELTVERFLNKGLYYLLSASLYQSEYKTTSNKWYNTRFNGNTAFSFTGGKEIKLKGDKRLLGFNIKVLAYGGYRETPIDLDKSKLYGEAMPYENRPFELQLPAYFRTDLKVSYRLNHKKFNSVWSLDIQNASNRKNIGGREYDAETNTIKDWYQTPLIPILSYKIEF